MSDLQTHIRSKDFSNELMFRLLDIARRDTIPEELIDVIAELASTSLIETLEVKAGELERENLSLLTILAKKNELVEELRNDIREINEISTTRVTDLTKFLETFEGENDRHPCIEETWEAAWTAGSQSKK